MRNTPLASITAKTVRCASKVKIAFLIFWFSNFVPQRFGKVWMKMHQHLGVKSNVNFPFHWIAIRPNWKLLRNVPATAAVRTIDLTLPKFVWKLFCTILLSFSFWHCYSRCQSSTLCTQTQVSDNICQVICKGYGP